MAKGPAAAAVDPEPSVREFIGSGRYTAAMPEVLHITNGDSAGNLIRDAGMSGDILPWRDVLHEGPVPAGLDLAGLSGIRADFIASRGWGDSGDIARSFRERDRRLQSFAEYDKVTLWFEHDLYDQLQILQVLDWFADAPLAGVDLTLICTDNYLGCLDIDGIRAMPEYEEPVTDAQLTLAGDAWARFRAPTPESWCALADLDTACLPFLGGAVERMLQEFPNVANGLSRTAHSALNLANENPLPPGRLFAEQQGTEERIFMGDLSFWSVLHELLGGPSPLVSLASGRSIVIPGNPNDIVSLTDLGRSVLAGERNWLDHHSIDRWIGGVHLTTGSIWVWDDDTKSITPAN